MDAKNKMLDQLSDKLIKRALEFDRDAARLNGVGNIYAAGLRHCAEDLRAIAEKLK